MKILVIIPAYNEAASIASLLKTIQDNTKIDVVVVNDCSVDDTEQICKNLHVNVLSLPTNLGIGGAVQTGYKYAYRNNYDIAIQMDGDGQHNSAYISALIQPIIDGNADMTIGSRYIGNIEGFKSTMARRAGIRYFSNILYVLTKHRILDVTSGFRACNKNVIKLFADYYPSDYPEPETNGVLLYNGLKVVEVPVAMNERQGGKSSISPLKSIWYMIKVTLAILICVPKKRG